MQQAQATEWETEIYHSPAAGIAHLREEGNRQKIDKPLAEACRFSGAADRTRTGTVSLPADFKSALSTYSNTAAKERAGEGEKHLCTAYILSFLFPRVKREAWHIYKKTAAR